MGNDDINYQRDRNLTFDQIRQDMAQTSAPQIEFPTPTQQPAPVPLPQVQNSFVQSAVQQPDPQVVAQQQALQAKEKQLIQMALSPKSPSGSQISPQEAQQIENANPADDIIPDVAQQGETYYHGTTPELAARIKEKGFEVGKRNMEGVTGTPPPTHGLPVLGEGVYLTPTKSEAANFGKEVLETKINPQIKIKKFADVGEWFQWWRENIAANPNIGEEGYTASQATRDILKKQGYGGVRVPGFGNKGETYLAVFNPNDISLIIPSSPQQPLSDMTLYRGGSTKYDTFDATKAGTGEGSGVFGKGVYLTDNKDVADFYAHESGKRQHIQKYEPTGIFSTDVPVYKPNADELAKQTKTINEFKVKGKILNADTYPVDDGVKKILVDDLAQRMGGDKQFAENSIQRSIDYASQNKDKINNFKGELRYVIDQSVGNDPKVMSQIQDYFKSKGYDGIKFSGDQAYEGAKGNNYLIFDPNKLSSPQQPKKK